MRSWCAAPWTVLLKVMPVFDKWTIQPFTQTLIVFFFVYKKWKIQFSFDTTPRFQRISSCQHHPPSKHNIIYLCLNSNELNGNYYYFWVLQFVIRPKEQINEFIIQYTTIVADKLLTLLLIVTQMKLCMKISSIEPPMLTLTEECHVFNRIHSILYIWSWYYHGTQILDIGW